VEASLTVPNQPADTLLLRTEHCMADMKPSACGKVRTNGAGQFHSALFFWATFLPGFAAPYSSAAFLIERA
jgi:hypothetical protein